MVFELHIWGPAFGLPSIDASCLAAVAYLRKCLPPNSWVVIPSSDFTVSPFHELPALRHDDLWVCGYRKIVSYIRDFSHKDWDLDEHLNAEQRAECRAFTSFIESRGQPLLDLSLYVSSENYHDVTKGALGEILSWPNSWVIPHRLREKAKKRSEHLGLSGLDVDTAQTDQNQNEGLTAQIPQSLRKPKQTVSALLGRNAQKNRFRLDAITDDFLEPLNEKLGERDWLVGDSPCSVDLLAIAYLALMQNPSSLPHPWLNEALNGKYSMLGKWVQTVVREYLGPVVKIQQGHAPDASIDKSSIPLPWQEPAPRSWQTIGQAIIDGCINSISRLAPEPIVMNKTPKDPSNQSVYRQKQLVISRIRNQEVLYTRLVALTASVTVLTGTLFWKGLLHLPRRSSRMMGSRTFGEAGAMLGLG